MIISFLRCVKGCVCFLFFLLNTVHVSATVLSLNYTFTTAVAGTAVTVTWTTDNPLDIVNVKLIRMSIFTVVQSKVTLPNSGSTTFLIDVSHPPGAYQFYIETDDRTFWNYGPVFNLLVADACCQSQPDFLAAAAQGFVTIQQKCGISVAPVALNDCQRTTYTWGDGSSTGPLVGNAPANHIYTTPGFYEICANIQEINALKEPCFTFDTCWQVCVTCDTCANPIVKDVWTKAPATTLYIGGNNSYSQICADAAGDFYMVGTYTGIFDNGADPDFPNNGNMDCVVAKYKNNGSLEPNFAFGIGSANHEIGAVIKPHPAGGFVVGGVSFNTTLTLPSPGGGSPIVLTGGVNTGWQSIFLARYSATRTLLWGFWLNGRNNTQINDMETDAAGNLYITGLADAALNFNPLGTPVSLPADGHAYIAKYDPSGILIWVRLFNAPYGLGLSLDPSNNVYVCGEFFETPALSGHPVPVLGFPSMGISTTVFGTGTPYVAKFNVNGDFQWAFALQNAIKTSSGANFGIKVNSNGLYVTGWVSAGPVIDFDPLGGNFGMRLPVPQKGFVARYNLNTGHAEKLTLFGAVKETREVATGPDGKIYVGGWIGSFLGPRILYVDIFDKDLNFLKSLRPGTVGGNTEETWAIAPDPFGDFAISGTFRESPFDADPQANDGPEFTFNDGLPHFFIGKYTCDCPGPAPVVCSPCDSVSVRFDRRLLAGEQPGKCCARAFINNTKANYFYGVQLKVVSGGKLYYSNATPQTGWQKTDFVNGVSVAFEPNGGGPIPVGTDDFAYFCMEDLTDSEQILEIQYVGLNDSIICRDTLRFHCEYCLSLAQDTVTCKNIAQRTLSFCLKVPGTQDWNVNSIVLTPPPGITFNPSAFQVLNAAPGTTTCTFETTLTLAAGTNLNDTLCFQITAHQMDVTSGQPPGECCLADVCVRLPDCLCDSTFSVAQPAVFNGNSCCWSITLHNPPGVFTQVNTHIVTSGVVFSAVNNPFNSGWDMSLHSMSNISWTPEAPQGTTVQDGYTLPLVCFEADNSGTATSPVKLAITWFTADSMPCYDTLSLSCPELSLQTDCVEVDAIGFVCNPPPLGHTIKIRVFNLTNTPAFDADRVQLYAIGPPGVNIGPAIFNIPILNGSYAEIEVHILNTNPGDAVCFYVALHDLNDQGALLHCCTSEPFCFTQPQCPSANETQRVAIRPNPATTNTTLYFKERIPPESRLRLMDVAGRVLFETALQENVSQHQLQIPESVQGLLFIELLERDRRIWTGKVVKQ